MSQLNVDTIGSQTGTSIAVASGHTLSNPAIGFEHIDTTTFTSAASWSKSSVFSATYDVYRIVATLDSSNYANNQVWFQLAASGTAVATGYVAKRLY